MMVGSILGWLVAGLIVGVFARLLVPGRQSIGLGMTIVLGIVGAMVGGFIAAALFGPNLTTDSAGYTVETAWPGWIMAVIGGTLVLWVVVALTGSNRYSNRLP